MHALNTNHGRRPIEGLSQPELAVIRLTAEGMTLPQIAVKKCRSVATIKRHASNAMAKLGAFTRAHAVYLAYRQGMLDDCAPRRDQ